MTLATKLEALHACHDAIAWVGERTPEQAWRDCERGDWMLWIAQRAGVDLKTLTRAKVECAKLAEHLMTDQRSIHVLRVAERYTNGTASRQELDAAAYAADAAASAAADAADASAAAAYAAAAADAADASAAAAAAYAAAAYAAAVYAVVAAAHAAAHAAAAADDVRLDVLRQCADICRLYIDYDEVIRGLE